MPGIADLIGTGAALCSMASFAPQIGKIWRERDATSVSLKMYAVTVTAFSLWIVYGMMTRSWPLVGSNTVCLILSATILALKWRFSRKEGRASAGCAVPAGRPSTGPTPPAAGPG